MKEQFTERSKTYIGQLAFASLGEQVGQVVQNTLASIAGMSKATVIFTAMLGFLGDACSEQSRSFKHLNSQGHVMKLLHWSRQGTARVCWRNAGSPPLLLLCWLFPCDSVLSLKENRNKTTSLFSFLIGTMSRRQ